MINVKFSILLPYFERPEQLRASLLSFSKLYRGMPLEVVIVDDGSKEELRPVIPENLGFPVTLVTLSEKDGINPCVPYNVGARHAQGQILVLSSPETCHIRSIFKTEIWDSFTEDTYLLFPVFAVTNPDLNARLAKAKDVGQSEVILEEILATQEKLTTPLGYRGYSFASPNGSWYCHPEFRPTGLNFLSAISRSSFENLGGFDERFRKGTGFDDLEFRNRIHVGHKFLYLEDLYGLHLEHEVVAHKNEFRQEINSNRNLYLFTKVFRRLRQKYWGEAPSSVRIIEG